MTFWQCALVSLVHDLGLFYFKAGIQIHILKVCSNHCKYTDPKLRIVIIIILPFTVSKLEDF